MEQNTDKFIKLYGVEWNATHISSLKLEDFIAQNTGNQVKKFDEREQEVLTDVHVKCTEAVKSAETAQVAAPAISAPAQQAQVAAPAKQVKKELPAAPGSGEGAQAQP